MNTENETLQKSARTAELLKMAVSTYRISNLMLEAVENLLKLEGVTENTKTELKNRATQLSKIFDCAVDEVLKPIDLIEMLKSDAE